MFNFSLWGIAVIGLISLLLLIYAANVSVHKLIGIAAYFNLSSTFMGMTIVSLATSIPEITSHLTASVRILTGEMDYQIGSSIVLGANIGSDVIQQTLILGLIVLLSGGLYFRRYFLWKSMIPMIGTTVMCLLLGWDRNYSRIDGAILFGAFIVYTAYLYFDEKKHFNKEDNQINNEEVAAGIPQSGKQVFKDSFIAFLMLIITIMCASIVLQVTEIIVNRTGVSGSLIGVITLGVASALPELATALAGIRKNESGISLGTLVGSNITNPLVGIGGGALVSGYAVPKTLIFWDLPWEVLTGVILWIILFLKKGRLGKISAAYFILLYLSYILIRTFVFPADF